MTIQSSSPRTSLVSLTGSSCRWAARLGSESLSLSRALGRGGSSSLISRSSSCQAASWKRCRSSGVVPVSSS